VIRACSVSVRWVVRVCRLWGCLVRRSGRAAAGSVIIQGAVKRAQAARAARLRHPNRSSTNRVCEFPQKLVFNMVGGLFINLLVGALKPDDVSAEVWERTYDVMSKKYYPDGERVYPDDFHYSVTSFFIKTVNGAGFLEELLTLAEA